MHHVVPSYYGGHRTIPLCAGCHGKIHDKKMVTSSTLVKAALSQKRENGEWLGRPRFGFLVCKDTKVLIPHKGEQMVISKILKLRADEVPYRDIQEVLRSEGLMNRLGKAPGISTIHRVAKNPEMFNPDTAATTPPTNEPYKKRTTARDRQRRNSRMDLAMLAQMEDMMEVIPESSRARIAIWMAEKYIQPGATKYKHIQALIKNIADQITI